MKKFLMLLCAMTLVFGMVSSASALITYDFRGGSGNFPSLDFTQDGVTSTATATWGGFSNSANVSRSSSGLGVKNHRIDNSDIDGSLRDDYLTLTFLTSVNLLGLNFGHDESNDEFDLFVNGTNVANNLETTGGWETFSLGTYSGTSFTIRANQANDNFVLSGLRIDAAPVPEPATILLMGVGLLGLVGYSRKRFSKKS